MISQHNNALSSKEDEIVLKVEQVSKKFSRSLKRSMIYGVQDIIKNIFRISAKPDRLRKDEFWAVNDVSFELKKGECLGIIGPNGAGKTTILSMLNGIYLPDKGKITIKGKTGALIAVGAGFHPMLTGRENIYIKGAIMGMSKGEIDEKFNKIVEFADIGDFLDMPVKNYSSGMFVRLGFSIAVHCEPEILLVDEILSVGDERFRYKSAKKMKEIISKTSIIFVSHSLRQISRICDRAILLNNGLLVCEGPPDEVIAVYRNQNMNLESPQDDIIILKTMEGIKRLDAYLVTGTGKKTKEIEFGEAFSLSMCIESEKVFNDIIVIVTILTQDDVIATLINSENSEVREIKVGENLIKCLIADPRLNPTVYRLMVKIKSKFGYLILEADLGYFRVGYSKEVTPTSHAGFYREKSQWSMNY